MGLTTGVEFHAVRFAPMGDPIEVRVRGYHLSLRKNEAAGVRVEGRRRTHKMSTTAPEPTISSAIPQTTAVRRVAIAGNPNCGKSTIFNALTGLRQRSGTIRGHGRAEGGDFLWKPRRADDVADLPGCYSLQARSPDEAVARDVLLGRVPGTPRPDVIVVAVDASNLERNLYLAAQILELNLPVILALNMVDMAEKNGIVVDRLVLRDRLGDPGDSNGCDEECRIGAI